MPCSASCARPATPACLCQDGFAEKVYHVHLRHAGDNDELYFRDYLNDHPQTAKEYEALKLRLWKRFEHDRDAYTEARTEFIGDVTAKAREEYGERYQGPTPRL